MKTLKPGDRGVEVTRWQLFLIGQKLLIDAADGVFGMNTKIATQAFQQKMKLDADGFVGNRTIGAAMTLGYAVVPDPTTTSRRGADWPAKPSFSPLVGTRERQKIFGAFSFERRPLPGNRENIVITGTWEAENIVKVTIPQLVGVKGAPASGMVRFHRLAARQFQDFFAAVEDAGLADRIATWGGSFVPRLVRGSATSLSNHAFGSAFDINVAWNSLGVRPALVGETGSVRELVTIANDHGLYWGGHFTRLDGMHFEIAQLR